MTFEHLTALTSPHVPHHQRLVTTLYNVSHTYLSLQHCRCLSIIYVNLQLKRQCGGLSVNMVNKITEELWTYFQLVDRLQMSFLGCWLMGLGVLALDGRCKSDWCPIPFGSRNDCRKSEAQCIFLLADIRNGIQPLHCTPKFLIWRGN